MNLKETVRKAVSKQLGGPGSGNFGHSGRPGEVGGSGEGGGGGEGRTSGGIRSDRAAYSDAPTHVAPNIEKSSDGKHVVGWTVNGVDGKSQTKIKSFDTKVEARSFQKDLMKRSQPAKVKNFGSVKGESNYVYTHGKKPSGEGNWAFKGKDGQTSFIRGKYSDAKKQALRTIQDPELLT